MKVRRAENLMDLTKMLETIENEEGVVMINCSLPANEAGMMFEKMQRDAGLIKEITWDVTMDGSVPVVKKKVGDVPLNFNYLLYECQTAGDDVAQSYTKDNGEKLIQRLKRCKLDSFQGFAFAKGDILYIMFNIVNNKGKRFGKLDEAKLSLVFSGD